jgi:hypothetical protein
MMHGPKAHRRIGDAAQPLANRRRDDVAEAAARRQLLRGGRRHAWPRGRAPARKEATALGSDNVAPSGSVRTTLGVPNGFLGSAATNATLDPDTCAANAALSAWASPGRAESCAMAIDRSRARLLLYVVTWQSHR